MVHKQIQCRAVRPFDHNSSFKIEYLLPEGANLAKVDSGG